MTLSEIVKITDYIFLPARREKADLALVFGTRHHEAVEAAAEAYREGLVPKILVSGGVNRVTGENEAERMKRELVELGVPEGDIITEGKSTNSLENVLFSLKTIDKEIGLGNVARVMTVVKHYHSRRALMTLRKHFPKGIGLLPYTYEVYGFTKGNWHETEEGRKKVLSEWEKIPVYLEKGNIENLD
jgi:uncharacterized SAM-binding protein YcdF (DUF218 family)